MGYTPTLVTVDEIRALFGPFLDHDTFPDHAILSRIQDVEAQVQYDWNGGTMPSRDNATTSAAKLLVAADIGKSPKISEDDLIVVEESTPDYDYTKERANGEGEQTIYEMWQDRAYSILRGKFLVGKASRNRGTINLVNK